MSLIFQVSLTLFKADTSQKRILSVGPIAVYLKVDFHCRVLIFYLRARVDKTETMYRRSPVNVKVKPRSTFALTGGLSYIASISFTHVNFTCVRTEKDAFWLRTLKHVTSNHVNKIEARYKVLRLNVKLNEVLLLRLRAAFDTLPVFYLRT